MLRFFTSLVISIAALGVHAAPGINIVADQAEYQVGDTVSVAISLSDSPDIHGGGLNVQYNPSVLQVQSVTIDNAWAFSNRQGVINNASGNVTDILFANFNGIGGDVGVATIEMNVIGSGDSAFSISESSSNPFADTSGGSPVYTVNNSFAFNNGPVEEAPAEEVTEQVTEQQATEQQVTDTSEQPVEQTSAVQDTVTDTVDQPVTAADSNTAQDIQQSAPATESSSNQTSNQTVTIGGTRNSSAYADRNETQYYLPSGPDGIAIRVTDDTAKAVSYRRANAASGNTYNAQYQADEDYTGSANNQALQTVALNATDNQYDDAVATADSSLAQYDEAAGAADSTDSSDAFRYSLYAILLIAMMIFIGRRFITGK